MTQEPELPALPARFDVVTRANPDSGGYVDVPVYSGDDLRAYATAAVLAERKKSVMTAPLQFPAPGRGQCPMCGEYGMSARALQGLEFPPPEKEPT